MAGGWAGGLLADDGYPGDDTLEFGADQAVGALVSFGHRRAVVLAVDGAPSRVHVENFLTRSASDVDDLVEECAARLHLAPNSRALGELVT